jgi:hypothetical protein
MESDTAGPRGFPAEVQMIIDENEEGKDSVGSYLTVMDAGT